MCVKQEKCVLRAWKKHYDMMKIKCSDTCFFPSSSTNGLIYIIVFSSVYKLPKGPPTFIARLQQNGYNICAYAMQYVLQLHFERGRKKKNSKRSILVVSDDTYKHTRAAIHNISSVFVLLCQWFLFSPSVQFLYDITLYYVRLWLRRLTKEVHLPANIRRRKSFCRPL